MSSGRMRQGEGRGGGGRGGPRRDERRGGDRGGGRHRFEQQITLFVTNIEFMCLKTSPILRRKLYSVEFLSNTND